MSEPILAVDRALDILLYFSMQTPQLSMIQITEQGEMNKSTEHPIHGTIEKDRFVQRDPDRLRIGILEMAFLMLEKNSLRKFATSILKQPNKEPGK